MTYFIRIFCQSQQTIPRYNIGQFILDGVFFIEQPKFIPALNEFESRLANWESFEIRYISDQRPIILTCNAEEGLFEAERDNLIDLIPQLVPASIQSELIETLSTAGKCSTRSKLILLKH